MYIFIYTPPRELKMKGYTHMCTHITCIYITQRDGGLGSRPKKMYGKRLGDGVEYHLMRPTPRC